MSGNYFLTFHLRLSFPERDVDILIGLNMNELQPAGGLGNDRVGGLTVLRSLFGCGWVVG